MMLSDAKLRAYLAARAHELRAAKLFQSDPYGCHSQVLVEKRRARNPLPGLTQTVERLTCGFP